MLNCHFKNIFRVIFIREIVNEIANCSFSVFRTQKRYNSEHERKKPVMLMLTTIFESMIRKLELAVNNATIFSSLIYIFAC